MPYELNPKDPYYIDFPGRVSRIQKEMAKENINVYLGSRLRTLSWVSDAFCPWRSYVVIPADGLPTVFTFVIDAARIADESWLDEDHVLGYAPMGGMDQITIISDFIKDLMKGKKGRIGYESGMSNYLPEGNLTHYEYECFRDALSDSELVNAHNIVDQLSIIKDQGTINRFRKAAQGCQGSPLRWRMERHDRDRDRRYRCISHAASRERMGMVVHRRKRDRQRLPHRLGRMRLYSSHNPDTEKGRSSYGGYPCHVQACAALVLKSYKAGASPLSIAEEAMAFSEDMGFAEYMLPGFEHGIGMMGDEWRIGMNEGPLPYWTNPDHIYQENEVLICAMQYSCPQEAIGFRYENPIVIGRSKCEPLSKFGLRIEVIE